MRHTIKHSVVFDAQLQNQENIYLRVSGRDRTTYGIFIIDSNDSIGGVSNTQTTEINTANAPSASAFQLMQIEISVIRFVTEINKNTRHCAERVEVCEGLLGEYRIKFLHTSGPVFAIPFKSIVSI